MASLPTPKVDGSPAETAVSQQPPLVYVVDDDEAVLHSLVALLESHGNTVRGFATPSEFLEQFDGSVHGCIVTDWRMPDIGGMQLLDELRSRGMPMPVIVLTAFADVPMAVSAMRTGAVTVLQKPCPDSELFAAVKQALEADLATRTQTQQREEIRRRMERLSDGEREVMQLALAGRMNREIAEQLGIGLRTVEKRRHNVMAKMQVDSLAELMQVMMTVEAATS
jgi:two-component system, LuxR family, response regulator TtrR